MIDFVNKAKDFGIVIDENSLSLFEKLYSHLVEENEKFNLTAITEKDKVYLLHFLDSLSAYSLIPDKCTLCDVGSGAGFPSIPLKIVKPQISLTMIDSVNKKVNYLNGTVGLLGLENSVAVHTRVEDFASTEKRESFDVVVSRAVARFSTLAEYCLPLVKIGGKFIAYKSDVEEELEESKKAIKTFGGKISKVLSVNISDDYKRTLVVIEKISPCPKSFPRKGNKPKTSPIL